MRSFRSEPADKVLHRTNADSTVIPAFIAYNVMIAPSSPAGDRASIFDQMVQTKLRWLRKAVILTLLILAFPRAAVADVGVPMLAILWPGFWILLIPIILFEGWIAKRLLILNWRISLKISGLANLTSTLLGIPLTWCAVFAVEMLIGLTANALKLDYSGWSLVFIPIWAAWLPPLDSAPSWFLPSAAAFLCIPFFFASVWIEAKVACRLLGPERRQEAIAWSKLANFISYSVIFIGLVIFALLSAFKRLP